MKNHITCCFFVYGYIVYTVFTKQPISPLDNDNENLIVKKCTNKFLLTHISIRKSLRVAI